MTSPRYALKMVWKDFGSLTQDYARVYYRPGTTVTAPGNGIYAAVTGGLDLGGIGSHIALLTDLDGPTGVEAPEGVVCVRSARAVGVVPAGDIWRAYAEALATARRAYAEATSTAGRAYGEATAPAQRAYAEALATARRAYGEATSTAGRAYAEATAPAQRAYDEALATARRAYREALAPAWAALVAAVVAAVGREGAP